MVGCQEKTLIAASVIFGGLTFLLPSFLTITMYVKKWIPEEPDPNYRRQMKMVLAGSVLAGIAVVGSGVWYLKKQKCL